MYMLRYALMNEIFIYSWKELTGFLWILTINTDENICYIRKYARQYTHTAYNPLAYLSGYQSRFRPVPLSQVNNNAVPLGRFEPVDLKSNTLSLRRCTHVLHVYSLCNELLNLIFRQSSINPYHASFCLENVIWLLQSWSAAIQHVFLSIGSKHYEPRSDWS